MDRSRRPGRVRANAAAALLAAAPPVPAAWCREDGADLILELHVQPGAKRTGVAGAHGSGAQARLRLRLAAPPVDGKANAELLRFVADAFGVPLRQVTLVRGEASRQKTVRIARPLLRPDRDWRAVQDGRPERDAAPGRRPSRAAAPLRR